MATWPARRPHAHAPPAPLAPLTPAAPPKCPPCQVIPIYGRGSDFDPRQSEAVKVQPVPPRPAGQRPTAAAPGAPPGGQQGVLPALFGFQLGPGQGYVEALTPEQQHQVRLRGGGGCGGGAAAAPHGRGGGVGRRGRCSLGAAASAACGRGADSAPSRAPPTAGLPLKAPPHARILCGGWRTAAGTSITGARGWTRGRACARWRLHPPDRPPAPARQTQPFSSPRVRLPACPQIMCLLLF
jgi:hypothetical protein